MPPAPFQTRLFCACGIWLLVMGWGNVDSVTLPEIEVQCRDGEV